MNQSGQAAFEQGLLSFRSGNYESAVEYFRQVLNESSGKWECRLYLAMAYARQGKALEARREFMNIRDFCPEPELAKKAASAFQMLSTQASGSRAVTH